MLRFPLYWQVRWFILLFPIICLNFFIQLLQPQHGKIFGGFLP